MCPKKCIYSNNNVRCHIALQSDGNSKCAFYVTF